MGGYTFSLCKQQENYQLSSRSNFTSMSTGTHTAYSMEWQMHYLAGASAVILILAYFV